ncbi:Bacterial regulatory proteins, tetR family [Chryseobacterium taihuense]|uniref:Bacterial regulatory proteins, tetR family n=2 Tax=Chryseobacterium group TaxID=2782232 RepID=A0A4V6YTH6_9FLAO|nr:Bacterial regulatory proteins, tetR family [Chryseobacterium taihuense]
MLALQGENALKIEMLAKKIGISKSSFYHHFADMQLFVEALLNYHLEQSKVIAEKEKLAQTIQPELIEILVAHRIDLLFNRQLRFNQQKNEFRETLEKSNQIIGNEFVRIWATDLQLNLSVKQLESIFELALENFFLQINPENITFEWISNYFENLKRIAKNFE